MNKSYRFAAMLVVLSVLLAACGPVATPTVAPATQPPAPTATQPPAAGIEVLSPDGTQKFVITQVEATTVVTKLDVATGAKEREERMDGAYVTQAFSPDGTQLFVITQVEGTTVVTKLDVATGAKEHEERMDGTFVQWEFSPDGTQLFVTTQVEGTMVVTKLDVATGQASWDFDGDGEADLIQTRDGVGYDVGAGQFVEIQGQNYTIIQRDNGFDALFDDDGDGNPDRTYELRDNNGDGDFSESGEVTPK